VARRGGLGRGLAALMAEFPAGQVVVTELALDAIRPNPRQPRRAFDEEAIARLAESIAAGGVLQPVLVRDAGDAYELVAGERRWRAAAQAGLATMPAIVREADDREALVLALAENLSREDLNAVEQARAYATLADELDLSHADIARRVGRSRPAVANALRLLDLPDPVLQLIARGDLSEGHGRALLGAVGQDARALLARRAVERDWSVRDTEAAVRRLARAGPRRPAGAWVDEELANRAIDAAWQALGLRAAVRAGRGGGRLEIRFSSGDELARIIERLGGEPAAWAD
jgi:ParB family transcriptional regulator, chromosome partitioning protein